MRGDYIVQRKCGNKGLTGLHRGEQEAEMVQVSVMEQWS